MFHDGLSEAFDRKYKIVCQNKEFQELIDDFNNMVFSQVFNFLNSRASVNLQDNMRQLEVQIIDNELEQAVILGIDEYENSMIEKIYSYCMNHNFNSAVFICGVAHRKSIIEKIEKSNGYEKLKLNWIFYPENLSKTL
ncbi:hypothetical protein [Tamlana flava]|uniref:hypothetical protein n=1 Tax=Tamlana flava TaxID=3158572 RepID=UPI00351BE1AE